MSTYKAWHYVNGAWSEADDPLMGAWAASDWAGGEEQLLKRFKYELLFNVGQRGPWAAFEVWVREEAPRHVFVSDTDEQIKFLYVDAYPDVLALAAQWSALVRDAQLVDFLRDLSEAERSGTDRLHGLVETIARRARQGWSQ